MVLMRMAVIWMLIATPCLALRVSDRPWPFDEVKAVVMQFDSRKPLPETYRSLIGSNERYYNSLPGHKHLFFDNDSFEKEDAESMKKFPNEKQDCAQRPGEQSIVGPEGCMLSAVWGKVKSMKKATEMYPEAEYFLFLDSDMAFNYKYNISTFGVPELYEGMAKAIGENTFYVPYGPWTTEDMLKGTPYKVGVTAGSLVWKGGKKASDAVNAWYMSSLDDYDFGIGPRLSDFRWDWPRDQNRLIAIMNEPAYHDTGVLFTETPPRHTENPHWLYEHCATHKAFLMEKPYSPGYECPIHHYTSVNVRTEDMAKEEPEVYEDFQYYSKYSQGIDPTPVK